MDTIADPVVRVLPKESCTATVAPNPAPAVTPVGGCVVNASFAAAPAVTVTVTVAVTLVPAALVTVNVNVSVVVVVSAPVDTATPEVTDPTA